jgi:hypothetical protein
MKKHVCVAAALLFPAAAFADLIPSANVDAFYVPKSDVTNNGFDSGGGKGYGVRGTVKLPVVFLKGEYQHDKYDEFAGAPADIKIDLTRLGVGMDIGPTPLYGMVEYIHSKFDPGAPSSSETDSGFGAHVGIHGTPTPIVSLYGQLGYVKLGDQGDGLEYNLGAVVSVMPLLGLFADYRHTDLKGDTAHGKTTIADYRVGVRVSIP